PFAPLYIGQNALVSGLSACCLWLEKTVSKTDKYLKKTCFYRLSSREKQGLHHFQIVASQACVFQWGTHVTQFADANVLQDLRPGADFRINPRLRAAELPRWLGQLRDTFEQRLG